MGAYIYLQNAEYIKGNNDIVEIRGGEIRINYCDADCIIPLTVENKLVTECAFSATNIVKGEERTTLAIFTKTELEQSSYIKQIRLFLMNLAED